MADPAPYEVAYSFGNFQSNSPTSPLPGIQVDNELAGVATAIEETIEALKDVRRSDGALKNGIVTQDSLSPALLAGLADLDEDALAAVQAAIDDMQELLEEDIEEVADSKADTVHTHTATQVSVSAITGLVAVTVQAALAELTAYRPRTGDLVLTMDNTSRTGWVLCNDGTIGDASSGATTRANADCADLYALLWGKVSDTWAPVTTGRGASAAADFAAHKPLALTKMLGRALAVAGAGSGLTSRAVGQNLGAEDHELTTAELATHLHAQNGQQPTFSYNENASLSSGGGATAVSAILGSAAGSEDITAVADATPGNTGNEGDGDPHNNMQPTSFVRAFLKL